MEHLFNSVLTRIQEGMSELSLIDEDYGQLEAQMQDAPDTYPVTFPAVLITVPEVTWQGEGAFQRGTCRLTTRLCIDCYDDTHIGSGTEELIAERMQMANKLHKLLQGFRIPNNGVLVREKSRAYTFGNGIKVYEAEYRVLIVETA